METIIEQVFVRKIISTIVVVCIIIAILILIRWALKRDVRFKLIFVTSIAISVVAIAVLGVGLSKIFLDIQKKDYVTYNGEYIERGGGQKDLKTVVVYDDKGNEIRLLRVGASKKGTFEGTVIYGKRSKIVVEYSGILSSD